MQSLRQYRAIGRRVHDVHLKHPSDSSLASAPGLVEGGDIKEGEDSSSTDKRLNGPNTPPGLEQNLRAEHIIVEWDGPDDSLNPRNWSMARRLTAFAVIWINVFALDWASSADSQTSGKIAASYHVSAEAETLSSTMYTVGIAIGALFAGPISESVGRNPIYIASRVLNVAFLLGVALAPNYGAHLAFRFLAGLGGSTLLCIHGASTADLFNPIERTWAWPAIALASFAGTALPPTAGGWIAQSSISWRWAEWIAFILSGTTLLLTIFFLPETFAPILLSWKAKHLRQQTGNENYVSHLDLQASLVQRLKTALLRAWHMLVKEPIVILMGLWLIVVYIVIYSFLQGYGDIFGDTYGLGHGLEGTCFLAIDVGFFLFLCLVPVYYRLYKRKVYALQKAHGEQPTDFQHLPGLDIPEPEYRLWPSVLVAPAFPICLFWLGWTNRASISIWSSLGAVTLFGFCWAGIYVTVYLYILDVCKFTPPQSMQ